MIIRPASDLGELRVGRGAPAWSVRRKKKGGTELETNGGSKRILQDS